MNPLPQQFNLNSDELFRICKIEEKLNASFFDIHQHQYFEMVLFTKTKTKKLQHAIDFLPYPIITNRIYLISPKQTHQWLLKNYNGEFEGYFITFNESFIESQELLLKLFDFIDEQVFIELNENEIPIPLSLIAMIESSKNKNTHYVKSLLEALLFHIYDYKEISHITKTDKEQRFLKLRTLIEKHYKTEKLVSFYAKNLGLSSKRLNSIIKEISTKNVSQLIQQRVLLEAKRKLCLNQENIQDIAEELGYHDPSYFSRFFKKNEGISPNDFIRNMSK